MRLDAVNPGYTLTDLRPAGFEPTWPRSTSLPTTAASPLVTSGSVSPGGGPGR